MAERGIGEGRICAVVLNPHPAPSEVVGRPGGGPA